MKYRVEKLITQWHTSLKWVVKRPDGKIVWHSSSQHGAFHMAELFAKRNDLHEDLEAHPL
jgi:hypothetical protein